MEIGCRETSDFFCTLFSYILFFPYFCTVMDKKGKILHILMIFVVSAGLLFITESWWMSLGILMLLLLADAYIQMYQRKREHDKNNDEQ